jgi:hypothetical protein
MLPPGHGPRGGAAGLARPKRLVLPGNYCRQSKADGSTRLILNGEGMARLPLAPTQLRGRLPGLPKQENAFTARGGTLIRRSFERKSLTPK